MAEQGERERTVREIEVLVRAMEQNALTVLHQHLLSTDLTLQQLKVLIVLATTEGGATGRGLATTFDVSMASMSGLLDRLVARGVAARSEDPDDHRVRRVHATPLGSAAVRRLVAARPEFRRDILVSLRDEDLRALAQGIRAVSDQFVRMSGQD